MLESCCRMSEHTLGQCDEAQLTEVQALLTAFSNITVYKNMSQSLFDFAKHTAKISLCVTLLYIASLTLMNLVLLDV